MYSHNIRTSVEERFTGLSHGLLNAAGDLGAASDELLSMCAWFCHDYRSEGGSEHIDEM